MATKRNPGKFDCYGAAEPDEPMFILLGRDRHAPLLVGLWARLRDLDNSDDPMKALEALDCRVQMIEWADRIGKPRSTAGDKLIERIMADVCDLPDYTSPEDKPDLLQATVGQLQAILERHLLGR